ncbi:MAG: hypothetical protein ACREV5_05440, partial [Steroidobacter sp.]
MNIASRTKLPIESSFLRFAPASNVAASAGAACTRVQSTTCMAVALAASLMPAFASSSPRVLEEVAKIELPDPSYRGGSRVAVQGDDLIVAGHKRGFDPEVGDLLIQAAFLFKRQADSNWAFVTRLAEQTDSINFGEWSDISAAIDGDVMAVAIGPRAVSLHVFERTPAGWAIAPTARPLFFDTSDVEISNGTILVSDCCWSAAVVRKNELGVWARSAGVSGGFPIPPDDDNKGGDVDISGDAFIVANHKVDLFDFPGGPEARIYERTADAWLERARLTGFGNHPDDAVGAVAIDASTAYVGGSAVTGLRVFDRSGTGEWLPTTTIAPPDTYMIGKPLRVEAEGYVAVAYPADPNRRGSVGVFQRQRSGEYEEIARLVRSDAVASSAPIDDVDIDVGPERTTLVVGT